MQSRVYLFLTSILLLFSTWGQAQTTIGAQVWVEPGMDAATIDKQFAILAQHNMPLTRLFMVWSWMQKPDGSWDFSLYDQCFESAQKHNVRVVATLMQTWGPTHQGYYYKVQDGTIARNQQQLDAQAAYIKQVVAHFAKAPALQTWMLANEPGQFPSPDTLAVERFKPWLKQQYGNDIQKLNKAWMANFPNFEAITYAALWKEGGFTWPDAYTDWNTFWREHMTWYLNWVATEVKKHDPGHEIHVNPHALLDITSKYDLPSWRKFLTSLGCSIHPVWHFDILKRDDYSLGVSFVSDMIRGASEPKPFWITELQGGHNIYTGTAGIVPAPNELQRWVWTGLGCGASSIIYWCLNPRLKGTEAGEWALLDYQYNPTPRLTATAEVTNTLKTWQSRFAGLKPMLPEVYLMLSLPTMTLQERAKVNLGGNEARGPYAHKFEALGIYKSLTGHGYKPQVKFMHDFDWAKGNANGGATVILPHTTALTAEEWQAIGNWAKRGNTVILTGLPGLYDHKEALQYISGHCDVLQGVLGIAPKEVLPSVNPQGRGFTLTASAIKAGFEGKAWVNYVGQGKVIYYPETIGLNAWFGNASQQNDLALWLFAAMRQEPKYKFMQFVPGLAAHIMRNKQGTLSIVTNSNTEDATIQWNIPLGRSSSLVSGKSTTTVAAGGTTVVWWE